ncbi:sugar ABC transporter substrate-binding protein [Actinoallomurus sp. CA-150999]|uniref:sugar ABC transporter substrate-binding protein n=1 Tax=Actinoallomurus sp. CA-150999 TaxID=3239887 RepID=UPI003D9344C8
MPALIASVGLALGMAACSSGGPSGDGSSTGAASAGVDKAAVTAAIKSYVGQPSAFPITDPLKQVRKGATIAWVDNSTPISGLLWSLLQPAGKAMGVNLVRYSVGSAADKVSAGFDSVLAARPAAVIVGGIDPQLWHNQLTRLQAARIPVVTTGILGTQRYGIKNPQAAEAASQLEGKLMADYVAAKIGGNSKVAFYDVPELSFTSEVTRGFQGELARVCSNCSVRVVHIPIATIGNTAPNHIVSDLQTHPDTTIAVFASDETETGLPAALQTAGITVKTMGASPGPTNLEYVKEGKETAALAVDLPVLAWTVVDAAAREMVGQDLTGLEAKGIADYQFLTKTDINFDPSKGWTGYPDFAQKFAKLWGTGA